MLPTAEVFCRTTENLPDTVPVRRHENCRKQNTVANRRETFCLGACMVSDLKVEHEEFSDKSVETFA